MSSCAFQILSDLHLETPSSRPRYPEFNISPKCPNLVLLGDIGLVVDERLFAFLERQLAKFETVFYLAGNHEFYDSSYEETISSIQEFSQVMQQMKEQRIGFGTFVFLNRVRFDINDDLTVLGCTLFSKIPPEKKTSTQMFVSDFERIEDWTPAAHNAAHTVDLRWLNEEVEQISSEEPSRRIAIFTHHSPTVAPAANDQRHLRDAKGISSAFMTDLKMEKCWQASAVRLWAFGHTHFNCDYVDSETGKRVVANQMGYARAEEAEGFDGEKVISITGSGISASVGSDRARWGILKKHSGCSIA